VILDALDRLMEGRTTIMIAHRLSTIRRADKILVIDGGRLVEVGTQDELLERDGAYASLWRAQTTRRVRTEAARAAIAKVDTAGTNGGGHALALETVSAQ
jgi:ATP-binding cassette subfamily B protein